MIEDSVSFVFEVAAVAILFDVRSVQVTSRIGFQLLMDGNAPAK